ncbi:MAG: NAD-dependent epimerase, partial [Mariprofundaceae bacterium]
GVFNAGSGEGFSINEIVAKIRDLADGNLQVRYSEGRSFDVKEVVLDISRAKAVFGWEPEITLADGISDQLQWLKSELNEE